ncbi:hypothetical protein F7725_004606 [Dissostichus mawsoni]|uniref:TTF-type domain-containing protein n=1 Tax=Dissostichus mawsoni TaxID=36200 RepID=A0A7J5XJ72_DISMA|nr:hypothetical protein F7725_004606 [Dissostichus mawsoni]
MTTPGQEEKRYDPRDTTLKFVNKPDALDAFPPEDGDQGLCAEMSCGHAGQYKFKCPALKDGTVKKCDKEWSYQEVRRLAVLTAEEMAYFEEKMARLAATEYCEFKTCLKEWKGAAPGSDRCNNDGCINAVLELLKNCKTTALSEVQGVTACPSIRACPTCGTKVEHDTTGCKNIICPRCQVEFCFVCLKLTPECLQTSSYFLPCSAGVAPRQTSIPPPSSSTEETGASSSAVANASHIPGGAAVDKLDPTPNVLGFDEPCRPDISFPARKIGTETFERSFQKSWFTRWKWVHYVTEKDTVLCFTCCKAIEKGLRHNDRKTSSFTVGGFCNWRKATTKFSQHELSDIHSESERMIASLLNTPINALLSEIVEKEQTTARTVLELIFRSVRFIGSLGLSLRGHNNRDGVLWKLMMERTFTLPTCREWLQRRDNWMSDTVQNEILEIFAHAVQREIVSEAREHSFYGLTADATTDISTSEQFSITLQYVDSKLEAVNAFLGFYSAPDSTGETLFSCIKDVFLRLHLPLERLRGFCFDGAANMSGRISGVQAKLKEQCPSALYVHCSNHALDLVLQEVAREFRVVADTLNFVRSVSVVVGE